MIKRSRIEKHVKALWDQFDKNNNGAVTKKKAN